LGWATITHPFHPLRQQRFEVLKTRRVGGVDTLILRHPQLGSYAIALEWTDWRLPDAATVCGTATHKLEPTTLLELATLLAQVGACGGEALDG
jgi:hypothetical protein